MSARFDRNKSDGSWEHFSPSPTAWDTPTASPMVHTAGVALFPPGDMHLDPYSQPPSRPPPHPLSNNAPDRAATYYGGQPSASLPDYGVPPHARSVPGKVTSVFLPGGGGGKPPPPLLPAKAPPDAHGRRQLGEAQTLRDTRPPLTAQHAPIGGLQVHGDTEGGGASDAAASKAATVGVSRAADAYAHGSLGGGGELPGHKSSSSVGAEPRGGRGQPPPLPRTSSPTNVPSYPGGGKQEGGGGGQQQSRTYEQPNAFRGGRGYIPTVTQAQLREQMQQKQQQQQQQQYPGQPQQQQQQQQQQQPQPQQFVATITQAQAREQMQQKQKQQQQQQQYPGQPQQQHGHNHGQAQPQQLPMQPPPPELYKGGVPPRLQQQQQHGGSQPGSGRASPLPRAGTPTGTSVRSTSPEWEGESKAADDLHQLQQQFEIFKIDAVDPQVWEQLKKDIDALVEEAKGCSQQLWAEICALRDEVDGVLRSDDFQRTNRLRNCVQEMDEVQIKMEDGNLQDMTAKDYDAMISKVRRLREEHDELTAQGASLGSTARGVDAEQLMNTLKGIKQSVSENGLFLEETSYASRLAGQFVVLKSPNNGDCLFYSVAVSNRCLEFLKKNRTALGSPGATQAEMEGMLARVSNEELISEAAMFRLDAIRIMREQDKRFRPMLVESMDLAVRGMARDHTSILLREGLAKAFLRDQFGNPRPLMDGDTRSEEELRAHLQRPEALEVYYAVMGTPGVFGEKPEIEALSALMQRKVHLYYYHGERLDAKGAHQPAELFDQGFKGRRELNLLHSVSGRHFCPLVRRDLLKKEKEVPKPAAVQDQRPVVPFTGKCGVGVVLKLLAEGEVTFFSVIEVLKGGGAALQQVAKGDILRAVGGEPVGNMSLSDAYDMLNGDVGTFVHLELERPKKSGGKGNYSCHVQRLPVPDQPSKSGMGLLKGVTKGVKNTFSSTK